MKADRQFRRADEQKATRQFWQAVETRDASFDGQFVYAVKSTGIYCRPSCPSRRPARDGVRFFPSPAQAQQEGFRACLRCGGTPNESDARRVADICAYIDGNLETRVTLASLAKQFRMSPFHLQRVFKRAMGASPREYADAQRLHTWKGRAREGHDVTTALYEAGYGSSSRLYEKAIANLGMTPAVYRRGGEGMKISYVIADCPLGRMLVGFTDRGVSAVYLGDKDGPLESSLKSEYPRAEIHRENGARVEWVQALLSYLSGGKQALPLPLDLAGTAFQLRVWDELRRIPYGSTRTYSQVAKSISRPTAVRAVAHACAKNPVSLIVPCHRVVREGGDLAGYRWGLTRKQALLEQEQRIR